MKKICIAIVSVFFAAGLSAQSPAGETELSAAYYAALYRDGNPSRADSIKTVLLKEYPRGQFARRLAAESLVPGGDTAQFIAGCEAFRKDFPIASWYENPDGQGFVYVNFYRNYSRLLYRASRWDLLREIMPEMSYNMLTDLYAHGPMFYIMKAPIDPREYADISVDMIREIWKKRNAAVDMYGGGGIVPFDGSAYFYLAIEAEVLQRSGRPAEAVEWMEKIPSEHRCNQYAAGNESYVLALQSLGRDGEAVEALLGSAAVGRLTPKLFSMLREHYNSLETKPFAEFDDYYASLKTEKARENMLSHVRAGLMDFPYEGFSLKSVDGETVSSEDFAPDDIVVLDFWATWCAPCIAALSGMQLAVDKYSADEKVKFYFICTQDEPDVARVRRVWARGGYRNMTVLFDENREGGREYDKVYRSMIRGTSGIPQKAVLKGGRVRYVAEGYGGSPSGLMDEISAVVELLKAE